MNNWRALVRIGIAAMIGPVSCSSPAATDARGISRSKHSLVQGKTGREQTEVLAPKFPETERNIAPAPLPPRLGFSLNDGMSALGQTPLEVYVANGGKAVGEALLGEIAAQIRLASLDDNIAVPFKTAITDTAPTRERGHEVFGRGKIRVLPTQELDPARWYALSIERLPARVEAQSGPVQKALPGRAIGVRFSTGTSPRLTNIQICRSEAGATKVIVAVSERIDTAAIAESGAAFESNGAVCSRVPWKSDSGTEESIRFSCDGMAKGASARLVFDRDLKGAAGRIVRSGGATVDIPSAGRVSTGACEFVDLI
jgi:hypothetical protein